MSIVVFAEDTIHPSDKNIDSLVVDNIWSNGEDLI